MEPFFKLLLSVLLCHVSLSHQKVSATPVYGINETSSNSSFLDQPLLEPRKENEDETVALESPVAVGLERATTTAGSLSSEAENGKMLSGLEHAAATAETLSSTADDAKTHNDAGKVDGHRSPKLEYLAALVKQRGTTSPSPFRGLRRRKEGQAALGETEREGARGAAGTRRWFEESPRIRISVDAPEYVQRSAAKVSSHVMDGDDPGQVEAVYALGRSDNSGLFDGQRSPYSSSRGRSLANQLPGSGLYSRYDNQNGFNPNYGSGTRQSSRVYLPESDLSLLFEKLLKMEEDLSRLKETVLLQGSVHIRTSQRLESLLVSQLRVGLQNSQDSAKMLRKIEQCCRCSVPGRDADELASGGTRFQTVTDRAFNVTSSQRGRDAASNITSSQRGRDAASNITSSQRGRDAASNITSSQRGRNAASNITSSQRDRDAASNITSSQRFSESVSEITSSPAAAMASASYVTSRQREPVELMSKVKSPQRASAETRNHTRDDKGLREQGSGAKDSTRQENKSSAVFSNSSTQASPADPSLRNYSVGVPIQTMLFHTTPTTLSESASEVKISITETTVTSGSSASEISSESDSTDKGIDGKEESKKQPDEEKAKSRKEEEEEEQEEQEQEEKHDSERDEDDKSDEEEKEDDDEKGDSDSDESIESDEEEEREKDDNQKSNQLKKPYAVEDDDDKEEGNDYGEGDNNKDEKQNDVYAGGDNVGDEKHRKLKTYAGSDDKTNRSKSQMDDFKPVEDGEVKGETGKQRSESRKILLSTNATLQDYSSNKSRDDAGEYDSDKDKSVIATDDATLRGSPFDSANATVDDLNFTAVTAGHIANLTETTDPSVSSEPSTESLDVILKMTTLHVASRSPGRGDDVILTERTEDKGENYELDSRVDANRVTVANVVAVHDASTSGNVSGTTQRTHDASQNNQARQGSNTNAAEPVFFVDGGETVSVGTSAGEEVNTAAVTGTQETAAAENFLRRNHTPSVDHRNAQPAKGDGISNASSAVTKDALDGAGKLSDGKANGHGHTQSDEANGKVGRKDVVAEPAATDGDEKDRKGDRNAGKVRGSTSGRELTTTPRSADADPVNFEPSARADSNFTVPAVSTTIAIPATDVAENTTAATWRSPPAGQTTATASRPSTPTAARVATTRWSPRLPFTTTATTTTATTIPTSATTRSRGSRTQSISAGSKSASAEPDKPSLEVDLSAGTIKGDMLPGVTWVAPLHVPRNITSRRARERNRRGKRQIFPSCSFQGVLKFTFTPPGQGSPRLPTRYYHPRGRFQITRQGPESSGTAGNDSRRELELDLWFQNPKSWVFNLGDSIANNGYSGDGAVQENDCEVQGYDVNFAVYGSDKHPNVRQKLLQAKRNFIYDRVTLVVSDQTIFWNNHRGESASLRDPSLFALAGQSDSQGEVNYDVYLGLNRVIDGDYRSGQGLCRLVVKWLK